jgi:hypothetical protein
MKYFLENFERLYKDEYKPEKVDHIRFVPAIEAGGALFLGKPSEVCSLRVPCLIDTRTDEPNRSLLIPKLPYSDSASFNLISAEMRRAC